MKRSITRVEKRSVPRPDHQGTIARDRTDGTRALLDFLDAQADRGPRRRARGRQDRRRRLRSACTIRFFARDGVTVLTAEGRTRDVSRTGLGLVTSRHLMQNAAVHITVRLDGGREFRLPGEVIHARGVKGSWYLIGVRFRKLKDPRLLPPPPPDPSEDAAPDA